MNHLIISTTVKQNKRPRCKNKKSYPAQSKHRDGTAQASNSHGRVSIGRAAVAKLHRSSSATNTQYCRQKCNPLAPMKHLKHHSSTINSLGPNHLIPNTTLRRRSRAHRNDTAKFQRHNNTLLISSSKFRFPTHTTSNQSITATLSVKCTGSVLAQQTTLEQLHQILPRPKQSSRQRCSSQKLPRACIDYRGCRRQAAKQQLVSECMSPQDKQHPSQ
jgi:hypothetical protein